MVHDGCWSTVICSARERAELGSTSDSGWVLGCRLSIGHRGDHATDAEVAPRFDRRLWLEWNDSETHAQSLIDRNPCTGGIGARCMLFEGHGGAHWYAPTNGYLTAAGTGRRRAVDAPTGASVATATSAEHHHVEAHYDAINHAAVDPAAVNHAAVDHAADIDAHYDTIADHAPPDIPTLRERTVWETPRVDHVDAPPAAVDHPSATASPAVSAALDAVVDALSRLAEALRDERR